MEPARLKLRHLGGKRKGLLREFHPRKRPQKTKHPPWCAYPLRAGGVAGLLTITLIAIRPASKTFAKLFWEGLLMETFPFTVPDTYFIRHSASPFMTAGRQRSRVFRSRAGHLRGDGRFPSAFLRTLLVRPIRLHPPSKAWNSTLLTKLANRSRDC